MEADMEDPEMGARQPLLRRSSSVVNERLQFQESQRQVVVNVANNGQGLLARLLVGLFWLFAVALASLWLYLYIGSVYILIFHLDAPCDQPLGSWLLIWFILPSLHALLDPPPPQVEGNENLRTGHSFRQVLIHAIWFSIGCIWFFHAKTCQKTNVYLYLWVRLVINIYLFGVALFLVFPLVVAFFCLHAFRFYHAMIDYGWISNPKAASVETINNLEVVPYDPALFALDSNDPNEKRPAGECCCCSENFGPDLPIVRTQCFHYYHKQCLGEWLKLAKTCPLCRADLDDCPRPGDDDPSEATSDPMLHLSTTVSEEDDEAMARRLQEEENQAEAGLP